MTAEPWFKDGLRFACTRCGNCCTGAPGTVRVTDDEIAALAAHLEITVTGIPINLYSTHRQRRHQPEGKVESCVHLL